MYLFASSVLLLLLISFRRGCCFSTNVQPTSKCRTDSSVTKKLFSSQNDDQDPSASSVISRRDCFFQTAATTTSWMAMLAFVAPSVAAAEGEVAEITENTLEMKNFIDPMGLFALRVPKNYFTLRRSSKGDLPDKKTGQGRRGSSIFTAGDMAKAEVVAVERFPTVTLLEEAGIQPTGDISSFNKLGSAAAIAELITLREREKAGQANKSEVQNAQYSNGGKTLEFMINTEISVQNPELLEEQTGLRRLFRITVAKCTMDSNDGNIMGVFASALEQDFKGPDGPALREAVQSFVAMDQSSSAEQGS